MNELKFKQLTFGKVFEHGGVSYNKTNYNRGYYFEKGRKVFRTFKKSTIVLSEDKAWDI